MLKITLTLTLAAVGSAAIAADNVITPRPVPSTRPEMKQLLEDMKSRPLRIPLPELTEAQREELGERANSYESRLRYHYLPPSEGSVFGSSRPRQDRGDRTNPTAPAANERSRDFTRNADENMTLSYPFKTMLFWIVSRTNNCQYCLGHQEQKLSAAGLSERELALLDSDWSKFTPAEQAAFAFARKITFQPHLLSDDDVTKLRTHYTDAQILEMTLSVAGNNAINRWKEGTGVPQSQSGSNFFRRAEGAPTADPSTLPIESFLTPTPPEFQSKISIVATLDIDPSSGRPTGQVLGRRPPLESRETVEDMLVQAAKRKPRLPLLSEAEARRAFGEDAPQGSLPHWVRLLATFPNESRRRIDSLKAIDNPVGDLTLLQKAQVSWIIARNDRAWYATGTVYRTLKDLGQTDDQIFALDGDWNEFSPADRALFTFARNLASTPIALTDAEAAEALKQTSPRHVVQLINFVTGRAYFDRVTEVAGLPLEE